MVVLNSFDVVMMCKSLPKALQGGDCSTSYNKHVFFSKHLKRTKGLTFGKCFSFELFVSIN